MTVDEEVHIDAPPRIVWSVTVDVERWPEWTPTVRSVKRCEAGAFAVGSSAMLEQPGLPAARWVVTALVPDRRFTWRTSVRGIRMVATHELEPSGGGTRNRLRIEMFGLVARLLWPFLRLSVRRALRRENAGLKQRCEQPATRS